jgi:ferritin-like metal-binding protein YciE
MAKPSTTASSLKKSSGNVPVTNKNTASQNGTKTDTSKTASGKKQKTLEDMFEEELKDIYSAEKQLIEALPKMAEAAYSEELQDAFNHHLQQTRRHAERIEKVFDRLRVEHEEKKCLAMEGLIKEGQKIIDEYEQDIVRDSALIIGAQKIEHYEIAAYGSLCELADVLGYGKIRDILHRTLEEEEDTDDHLTMIAQAVNDEAYETSMEEQQENVY